MATRSRVHRGYRTQDFVAAFYVARGWAHALSVGNGRGGADITGTPGAKVEVKARKDFAPLGWLRQVGALAPVTDVSGLGERKVLHWVIFRMNGQGPVQIGQWGVLMTFEEHTQLLIESGRLPGADTA